MTAYYKMPGFTLARANLSTKVLVSLFIITVAAGLGVALLQYTSRAGSTGREAVEWVKGNEGDLDATELKIEKSYRELLSITHEHAFALPMLLFVLLHLVALCTVSERFKIGLYVSGFLSLMGSLAGPWLISAWGDGWNVLMRVCGVIMSVTIATASVLCLYEMWLAQPVRRWRRRPEPPAPEPMFPKRRDGQSDPD